MNQHRGRPSLGQRSWIERVDEVEGPIGPPLGLADGRGHEPTTRPTLDERAVDVRGERRRPEADVHAPVDLVVPASGLDGSGVGALEVFVGQERMDVWRGQTVVVVDRIRWMTSNEVKFAIAPPVTVVYRYCRFDSTIRQ